MASTNVRGRVHCAQGNVLLADANAGYTIVPDSPGRTLNVVGGYLVARGGAAAVCTSVDVKDTADVVAVACAQGSLTQDAYLPFSAAAGVTWTTPTKLTAGKGLKIANTGGACTTATSFDYLVLYTVN